MYYVYLTCFLLGGTMLVGQLLLGLLGLGHHVDAFGHDLHDVGGHDLHTGGHDHGGGHEDHHDSYAMTLASMLTFRTLTAALTFFGLTGLAALHTPPLHEGVWSVAVALAGGVGALLLVGTLMRSLSHLRADGTARIEQSVGSRGTVYLTVPGQKAGTGRVMVNVQNRTMEYQAITSHQELPTGLPVVVVSVVNSDTVEVLPSSGE